MKSFCTGWVAFIALGVTIQAESTLSSIRVRSAPTSSLERWIRSCDWFYRNENKEEGNPTACTVEGEIVCQTLDDEGRALSFCDDVADPSESVCGGGLMATGLGFRYNGGASYPEAIWITVTGSRTGTIISQRLAVGDRAYGEGDYRGEANVVVSQVNAAGTGPGDAIEQFQFDSSFEEGNELLRLTNIYGSLELTDYRNALGRRSSISDVRVSYFLRNLKATALIAKDAFANSDFRELIADHIPDPSEIEVGPRTRIQVHEETRPVDFGSTFATGEIFSFAMNVTGRDETSSLPCFDELKYLF